MNQPGGSAQRTDCSTRTPRPTPPGPDGFGPVNTATHLRVHEPTVGVSLLECDRRRQQHPAEHLELRHPRAHRAPDSARPPRHQQGDEDREQPVADQAARLPRRSAEPPTSLPTRRIPESQLHDAEVACGQGSIFLLEGEDRITSKPRSSHRVLQNGKFW